MYNVEEGCLVRVSGGRAALYSHRCGASQPPYFPASNSSTNHILSKRRKTKNKRLQEGGTLTVQEGQDLLAEKEGGSKQSQLLAAGGGCRKRVKTKGRKCSICNKSGYNARTY